MAADDGKVTMEAAGRVETSNMWWKNYPLVLLQETLVSPPGQRGEERH